jgi:hypothetical protein
MGGVAHFPTSDGRRLEVKAGSLSGEVALRFEFRDPEEMLPTDAIACTFRTTDRFGKVWSTTARFTAWLFVERMFDVTNLRVMSLFRPRKAEPHYRRAFQRSALLRDARVSSDDRFYRTLLVGKAVIATQFKYTVIHLDVAAVRRSRSPYLKELAIKIRRGSLLDEEAWDIGELGYYMNAAYLLTNTAVFDPEMGGWRDNPLPMPLTFSPTGNAGKPQANVQPLDG